MFYNLEYTKSSSGKILNNYSLGSKSKTNELEADFVANIFMQAIKMKGDGNFYKGLKVAEGQIGIITPYKRQSFLIRDKIMKQIQMFQKSRVFRILLYSRYWDFQK